MTQLPPSGWKSRFLSLVDVRGPDDCWPWKGYINPQTGYGQLSLNEAERAHLGMSRTVTAPVIACTMHHGPRPPGLEVLHSCDVKNCANPSHLRWGTRAENNAEAWERTRRWGEDHPNARYPDNVVVALLRDVQAGDTVAAAAEKHGVNKWTAYAWTRRGVRRHSLREREQGHGER